MRFDQAKPTIYGMDWYERKYGTDWAELVREEDIRLGRNSDGSYPGMVKVGNRDTSPSASWASHPINNQ